MALLGETASPLIVFIVEEHLFEIGWPAWLIREVNLVLGLKFFNFRSNSAQLCKDLRDSNKKKNPTVTFSICKDGQTDKVICRGRLYSLIFVCVSSIQKKNYLR